MEFLIDKVTVHIGDADIVHGFIQQLLDDEEIGFPMLNIMKKIDHNVVGIQQFNESAKLFFHLRIGFIVCGLELRVADDDDVEFTTLARRSLTGST